MLTRIARLSIALVAIILSSPSLAQVNCEALLRDGVFDVSSSASSRATTETLFRHTCNGAVNNISSGGQYYGISGFLNQDRSRQSCANFNRTRAASAADESYFREANGMILQAFETCANGAGLNFALSQAATPSRVRGVVNYRGTAIPAQDARIVIALPADDFSDCGCEAMQYGSCVNITNGLEVNLPSGGSAAFRCRRATTGRVTANLSSNQGNREASLPALTADPILRTNASPIPRIAGRCQWRPGGPNMEVTLIGDDLPADGSISFVSAGPGNNYASVVPITGFVPDNRATLTNIPMTVGHTPASRRVAGLYASIVDGGRVRLIATTYVNCPNHKAVNRIRSLGVRLERRNILDMQ